MVPFQQWGTKALCSVFSQVARIFILLKTTSPPPPCLFQARLKARRGFRVLKPNDPGRMSSDHNRAPNDLASPHWQASTQTGQKDTLPKAYYSLLLTVFSLHSTQVLLLTPFLGEQNLLQPPFSSTESGAQRLEPCEVRQHVTDGLIHLRGPVNSLQEDKTRMRMMKTREKPWFFKKILAEISRMTLKKGLATMQAGCLSPFRIDGYHGNPVSLPYTSHVQHKV